MFIGRKLSATIGSQWVLAIAGILAFVGALCEPVNAEERHVEGRNIQNIQKVDTKPVGDEKGHVLGRYQAVGVTLLAEGGVASYVQVGTFNYTDGAGTHQGHIIYMFKDGSTRTIQYKGTTRPKRDPIYKGTYDVVSGTGRFKGVSGKGSYTGVATGQGMNVYDWESTLTVPNE